MHIKIKIVFTVQQADVIIYLTYKTIHVKITNAFTVKQLDVIILRVHVKINVFKYSNGI